MLKSGFQFQWIRCHVVSMSLCVHKQTKSKHCFYVVWPCTLKIACMKCVTCSGPYSVGSAFKSEITIEHSLSFIQFLSYFSQYIHNAQRVDNAVHKCPVETNLPLLCGNSPIQYKHTYMTFLIITVLDTVIFIRSWGT